MPIHDTPYEIRKPGKPKEVNQDAAPAAHVPDPFVPDSLLPDPLVHRAPVQDLPLLED